ncbi:MAG: hypothetical protein GWO04_14410, partial [Actinobacteria bacterium]|nr:hypothetical protein [Actinomycetota bacterium]
PDFTAESPGTTSFTDAAGRSWSVNANAEIAGFTWTDISTRLRSAEWSTGRNDEFEQFPPAQATIVLDNRDRQL